MEGDITMKWVVLISLSAIAAIGAARAQSWPNAIRIYPDRIVFDWPNVNACASSGDVKCRIAVAARSCQ